MTMMLRHKALQLATVPHRGRCSSSSIRGVVGSFIGSARYNDLLHDFVMTSSSSTTTTIMHRFRAAQKRTLCTIQSATRSSTPTNNKINSTNRRDFSTTTIESTTRKSTTNAEHHPDLIKIRSLPVFGSLVSSISGIPPIDRDRFVQWWRTVDDTYGPFYSLGLPAIGSGVLGTVHVIRDPNIMKRVLQMEGQYPSGFIQNEWPMIQWCERKKFTSVGFFSQGTEWKRIRTPLQKDLLAPATAREYLPGILQGAAVASQKAPEFAGTNDLLRYLNFAAMDMFTNVLFGRDDAMSPQDYRDFCRTGVEGQKNGLFDILRQPKEFLLYKMGIESSAIQSCFAKLDTCHEIGERNLRAFLQRIRNNNVTNEEKNSYFYKLMQRQPESDITEDEAIEICFMLLLAAVDTTAGKTGWNIVQLALHPDVQERLYEQLNQAVQKEGGLTPTVIEKNMVPLLQATIRETHRCTPAAPTDIMKKVSLPVEVHGVELPAGSTVMFNGLSAQMDPSIVHNPWTFQPERWLKQNVEARKGTPASIVDHPFYAGPFSQGARRCPGSRVANLEVQSMIAQLLLDWKITLPDASNLHWKDIPGKLETLFVPQFPKGIEFVPR